MKSVPHLKKVKLIFYLLKRARSKQLLTTLSLLSFVAPLMAQNWRLTGNSGTLDGTHFIGTTDNVPFNIRVNNQKAGRIDPGRMNTFYGYQAANANLTTGRANTAIGYQALYTNTTGSNNTALGYGADVNSGNLTNATAIGYGAKVTAGNTIQLGNGSVSQVYIGVGSTAKLIAGGLQITGGTPVAGKVLTSDAAGNATWQVPIGVGGSGTINYIPRFSVNGTTLGNSQIFDNGTTLGIGTNVPSPAAKLDIMGRIKITDGTQGAGKVLTSDANGLATWQMPAAGGGMWSLTGNSGTIDGTHFIGTTNNVPFNIRVNNQKAGRIDPTLNNAFWGYQSGNATTTGRFNTAAGSWSLYSNTTGFWNTAIGVNALYSNSTGQENTATGYQALYSNTSGQRNTANGINALYSNTTGNHNTASGNYSLYSNTTGFGNTASGSQALFHNTTGVVNTAVGDDALYSNTTGQVNTATGKQALYKNTTGNYNTATGSEALYANTVGINNTATGYLAMYDNTTGNHNTAHGLAALRSNTTGSDNTALGLFALITNTTGNDNLALGYRADVGSDNLTNATAIGANAIVTTSNTIQLGNSAVTQIVAGTGSNAKLIAGGLQITGGTPGVGKVLTSDAVGNATWQMPGSTANGSYVPKNLGRAHKVLFRGTDTVKTSGSNFEYYEDFDAFVAGFQLTLLQSNPNNAAVFGIRNTVGTATAGSYGGWNTLTWGVNGLNEGIGSMTGGNAAKVSFNGYRGGVAIGWSDPNWNDGTKDPNIPYVLAVPGALNISANNSSQVDGYGALGQYSTILGGINHHIPATSPRSVVLGGHTIRARESDPDQVYVPNLNIATAPQTGISSNDVLVRDNITGSIKTVTQASLAGSTTYGSANQLPFMNTTNNGFAYSSQLTWNNTTHNLLAAGDGAAITGGTDVAHFGRATTVNASWVLTNSEESVIRGGNSLSSGWAIEVGDGINSFSGHGGLTVGTDNKNYNTGGFVGGVGGKSLYSGLSQRNAFVWAFQVGSVDGKKPSNVPYLTATGQAFNISRNTSAQVDGNGALAVDGGILGGIDHHIPATSPRSVIIGGNRIVARANEADQVYVPNLNIVMAPSTGTAANDILVRDSATGLIKTIPQAAIGGGNAWSLTGNAGMVDGTHFIGTTTNVPFNIRVNNERAGRIDPALRSTFYGYLSGNANTTGYNNTAYGDQALTFNTTGSHNAANGGYALYLNTTGGWNTANGAFALYSNTTGEDNTANGEWALHNNTTGGNNTAIGHNALENNTEGGYNIALGSGAGVNTQGNYNIVIGSSIDIPSLTGNRQLNIGNVLYGVNMYNGGGLYSSVPVPDGSIGIGVATPTARLHLPASDMITNLAPLKFTAGPVLFTPQDGAMEYDGSYYYVTASTIRDTLATRSWARTIGDGGSSNWSLTGNAGTNPATHFIGTNDNQDVVFKRNNIMAGLLNSDLGNTSYGVNTFTQALTGSGNTAIGKDVLSLNTTGYHNTALGSEALSYNTTGHNNTANGSGALSTNTTGSSNVASGVSALGNNTTGQQNVGIGTEALLSNATGYNNTAIGSNADVGFGNLTNAMALGANSTVSTNNAVVIGNSTITNIGGYANWSTLSDARFKKDVQQDVHGLDFIMKLKPVTYTVNVKKLNTFLGMEERRAAQQKDSKLLREPQAKMDAIEQQAIKEKEAIRYNGFMAQEVEQAAQQINYSFSGVIRPASEKDHYKLSYSDFVVPLVKAVQEQEQKLETQGKTIEQLQQQVEELKKLVVTLSHNTKKESGNEAAFSANTRESAEPGGIKVYPNPNSGFFTIATRNVADGIIEVYDGGGKKVKTVVLKNNTVDTQLDLSNQPKGMYIVHVSSKGETLKAKVMIE